MEHISLDFDLESEDLVWEKTVSLPIEAKLRLLAVGLLYEVCRVQKFSVSDLSAYTCCDLLAPSYEKSRNL